MNAPSPLLSALTPEMAGVIDAWSRSGAPNYAQVGVAECRAMYRRATARGRWEPSRAVDASDVVLGDRVGARLYRPRENVASLTPIVYLHGGGFLMGDLETHDSVCRELSAASALPVVAVEYPLAPEQPFPAAPEFALGLIALLVEAAPRLELDVSSLVLAGDSAGACLAAIISIGASGRERVRAQCLFYPATDLRCDTGSFREIASGYPLTGRDGVWFTGNYLASTELADDWRASPLLAESLVESPPTFLLTVGHDPLRDEGLAFGDRLEREGIPTVRHHLPGHVHGFLTNGASVPEVRSELAFAAGFIRGVLASRS